MNQPAVPNSRPTERPPAAESWIERSGFLRLFEALHVGRNWTALMASFLGIALTCLLGISMDAIWFGGARPVVDRTTGLSELGFYLQAQGDAGAATRRWVESQRSAGDAATTGVFSLLLHHARLSIDTVTDAVRRLDAKALLGSLTFTFSAAAWLYSFHPLYGVVFGVVGFIIWGYCGGAASRAAAIQLARRDAIPLSDALAYTRVRLWSFFLAPMAFPALILLTGALLWIIGLVGAIPRFEVLVGLVFPIALILGIIAGACLFLFVLTAPMLIPAIAADDLDPWEAFSQTIGFVWGRPWKYAACLLTSVVYGAICILILKLFVAASLWLTGSFLGASMNWGDAYALNPGGLEISAQDKLTKMWQPPRPGDERPFIGTFEGENLRGASDYGRRLIKAWIWVLWGLVAAFTVSFYYASGTIVYFIMRRDLNDTDMEDVYLEGQNGGASSAAKAVGE